jgi:hypothetical protein
VTPTLGTVVATMRRHLTLLVAHFLTADPKAQDDPALAELKACRDMRKHMAWYLKGYTVGQEPRAALGLVDSLTRFDDITASFELDQPYPGQVAEGPRGRGGSPQRVALPDGWLDDRSLDGVTSAELQLAELSVSGG